MLLENKNAVIYGGGGNIGAAIGRAFGEAGARVFLAGRTRSTLASAAETITGEVSYDVVDAMSEAAVDAHAATVVGRAGSLDISVNVISDTDVQGTPVIDMPVADYLSPVQTSLQSKLITSRAAARHMKAQRSGVILAFGGQGDPNAYRRHHLGGLVTGFAAVEELRRQLAAELGPYGIRVLTLHTGGVPEVIPPELEFRATIEEELTAQTVLGRTATLKDVGNVAVFAASDMARTLTGTSINMTCGAVLD